MGSLWPGNAAQTGASVIRSIPGDSGFSNPFTAKRQVSPASGSGQTVAAFADGLSATASVDPIAHIYDSVQTFGGDVASALNHLPTLTVEDAKGQRTALSDYLNPSEVKLLSQLPENYRNRLLNVDSTQPVTQMRAEMQDQLMGMINQMVQSKRVYFKQSQGAQWNLEAVLGLANAVNRLPIAQRKQLDGVTFMRASHPDAPSAEDLKKLGSKVGAVDATGMLAQVAMNTIAGQYDLSSKTVNLYDRGVDDGLPDLNVSLRQSLRTIGAHTRSEDMRQLQKMLNPYLARMNQPAIAEDGGWGSGTARAVRMVQIELLGQEARSKYGLNAKQVEELNALKILAASPQFDLISRMTDVQAKMQNLFLLPDPHLKQLLQEFTRSEFGETSLKYLMQDISNDFRSTPSVSRVEEIMTHEMGHHFQLGQSNESHYISEFGKLSNWRETANGEQADGYVGGQYMAEDLKDVYQVLASDGKVDQGHYTPGLTAAERSQKFVSTYAATDPMEDFAESYKDFVLNPKKLLKASPEKFFFINSLPAIQARKTGAGSKEASHYQPSDIESMVGQILAERFPKQRLANGQMPFESVKSFIRQQFESLMGANGGNKLGLNPEVVLAIMETHRKLLADADMPYVPSEVMKTMSAGNADNAVFSKLHEQTERLLVSGGKDLGAQKFFSRFETPGEIDKLFPQASPALRKKLKDPAFSAMMLALGKIGGHAAYINQLQNKDQQQMQQYQQAKGFFSRVLEQPSSLLSNQTFSYSWNYLRGLGSSVFNPEESKISDALDFFQELEKSPQQALPDVWTKLPADFQDLLRNRRFIMAVSGDYGRYLPSADSTRQVLEEVMDMLEFQRGLDPS